MHGIKLSCPHCRSSLKFNKAPRPNKEIPCPRCGEIFFGWEAAPVEEDSQVSPPAPASTAPTGDDATSRTGLLVVGCIALGLLVLGGLGYGMHLVGRDRPDPDKEIAAVEPRVVLETPKSEVPAGPVSPVERPGPAEPTSAPPPAPPPESIPLRPDVPSIPLTKESAPKPAPPPPKVDPPAPPPVPVAVRKGIPGPTPEAIDQAIERGAEWLKRQQTPTGSWVLGGKYPIGYAALPGLTLLECKVPPSDPQVQRAAAVVRAHAGKLDQTYELATAILFLDRLGDPRDRILIQACALRLVAGQTGNLGWDYRCPQLDAPHMQLLLTTLESTKPKTALPTTLPGSKEPLLTAIPTTDQPFGKPDDPFPTTIPDQGPGQGPGQGSIDPHQVPGRTIPDNGNNTGNGNSNGKGIDNGNGDSDPKEPKGASGKAPDLIEVPAKKETEPPAKEPKIRPKAAPKKAGPNLASLPPALRAIPALGGPGLVLPKSKGKGKGFHIRDDNSNSQFAMLALWAARRHGVATDRALQLAHRRYRATQNADAGWGYHLGQKSTASMTGVGMLGLGMGLGTAEALPGKAEAGPGGGHVRVRLDDPAMKFGLARFAEWVGEPDAAGNVGGLHNLYFLWTVERVAMLYNLRTIGGKDWYGWGAQNLLKHQTADGNWFGSNYPGNTPVADTCLALLFLKRSNLVDDLSHSLQLYTVIQEK